MCVCACEFISELGGGGCRERDFNPIFTPNSQTASLRGISKLRSTTIIESFDPRQSHIESVSITWMHLARVPVNS